MPLAVSGQCNRPGLGGGTLVGRWAPGAGDAVASEQPGGGKRHMQGQGCRQGTQSQAVSCGIYCHSHDKKNCQKGGRGEGRCK